MLFARSYNLNACGSKRMNVGLAVHKQNIECIAEFDDCRRGYAVQLIVHDPTQLYSAMENVLLKLSDPLCYQKGEFTVLNSTAKFSIIKNDCVILKLKSNETNQCVYLAKSSVWKLDDLLYALYSYSRKLLSRRKIVKLYFDEVVRYITEHKATKAQLNQCIYNMTRNYTDSNQSMKLVEHEIRAEFYSCKELLFAKYCANAIPQQCEMKKEEGKK